MHEDSQREKLGKVMREELEKGVEIEGKRKRERERERARKQRILCSPCSSEVVNVTENKILFNGMICSIFMVCSYRTVLRSSPVINNTSKKDHCLLQRSLSLSLSLSFFWIRGRSAKIRAHPDQEYGSNLAVM